jgi:hypothetical protein
MKHRCVYVVGCLLFLDLAVPGQGLIGFSGGGGGNADGSFHGNATFRLPMFLPPALTNAPYSGEQVQESSQTLADGTHITRPNMGPTQKTWRDSQGRVRRERSLMGGNAQLKNVPAIVQIDDPVAGYIYIMDDENRVAHRVQAAARQARPTPIARRANAPVGGGGGGRAMGGRAGDFVVSGVMGATLGPPNGPNGGVRPETSTEDLGTQMIDGVLCYGTRTSIVIPVGQQGNDRPITTTHESWFSRDLQLTVLSTSYSPVSGTSTTKIANLSRNEPDPALFLVPADYTVVDETRDSFTIKWGEL